MYIEKGLSWYKKILNLTLPEPRDIKINPKNCIGTVLSLNGHHRYFCMYHAKHPEATRRPGYYTGGHVKGLKHNLSHLLTVGFGVKGSFSKKDRLLLRGNTQLIVEGVVPDLLHIIPVGDDSMLNRVLQGEDT